MSPKKESPSNILIVLSLAIGIAFLLLLFVGPELVKSRLQGWNISSDNPGQIGDVFGGTLGPFIAIIAAILTFAAFWVQYEANKLQKEQFNEQARNFAIERFEGRFFDLIKIHRENVLEMQLNLTVIGNKSTQQKEQLNIRGPEVIKLVAKQVLECKEEITPYFSRKNLTQFYKKEFLDKLNNESTISKRNINLRHLAINDIAWCITFFGLDFNGFYIVKKNLEQKYKPSFFEPFLNYLSLKPFENSENWYSWRKLKRSKNNKRKLIITDMILKKRRSKNFESPFSDIDLNSFYFTDDNQRYYGGFQLQLGHYFRHLYQTVNFVNDQEFLDYKLKYNYVKTLRAQLSTLEQVIFYYNSLSSLGNIWELVVSKRFEKNNNPVTHKELLNKQLITKYNLIKNMPDRQLFKQEFAAFYPDIDFEYQDSQMKRRNNSLYV